MIVVLFEFHMQDAYYCQYVVVHVVMKVSFCDYQLDKGLFRDNCNCC